MMDEQEVEAKVGQIFAEFIEAIPSHIVTDPEHMNYLCSLLVGYYLPCSVPEEAQKISSVFNQTLDQDKGTRDGVGLVWEATQQVCQIPQEHESIYKDVVKTLEEFMRLDANLSGLFEKKTIFSYKRYVDTHKFLYENADHEETKQETVLRVWHNYCALMDEKETAATPASREALLCYQKDLDWVGKNTRDPDVQKGVSSARVKIEQDIQTMPVPEEKFYVVKRPAFFLQYATPSFETH
ncbi:MAG: hypothetical protein WC612_07110 [Bdellovibrionales bacterium]